MDLSLFWKLTRGHLLGPYWKGNAMPKKAQTTAQLHSSYTLVTFKILQAKLQQYVNHKLPEIFKLDLEKAEEPEIKLATSAWSSKKLESSRKTSISALLTMPNPLTVWITTNFGKFFKRWEYQTTWPPSWGICMQVEEQQLELDVEGETGSKSGKEYVATLLI